MDKKDLKDRIKVIILVYTILIGIGIFVGLVIHSISTILTKGLEAYVNEISGFMSSTIGGIGFTLGLILLIFLLVYGIIRIKKFRDTVKSEIYIRDLPKDFPPAIASLLLDLKTEITTDYTATIAYLICKKYIELDDNNVKIINNNTSILQEHERYVFNCITKTEKFENNKFKDLIIEDATKMNLIKEGKKKIHFLRNFCICLIVYFIAGFWSKSIPQGNILNTVLFCLSVLAALSSFGVIIVSIYLSSIRKYEEIYRTKLGEEESIKWKGLKNFFNNYTLMSERELRDIALYEDYIPYAISLNEAKTIEKYIENNEAYRELIYGNRFI